MMYLDCPVLLCKVVEMGPLLAPPELAHQL